MRKILIILFFIFIFNLSSCKKEKPISYIEIGQVNIVKKLTNKNPVLNLHIYATTDHIIEFIPNILVENYKLKKVKTDYQKNLNTYELVIIFKKQEFKISSIILKDNEIESTYQLGIYQTITIKEDTNLINAVVNISKLEKTKCNLNITIFNGLTESIYLKDINQYKKNQFYGLNINKIDPYLTCVLTDNVKTYNNITITNDLEYEQISGILIFNYLTSLNEYQIYINYHINFNEEYMVHI